MADLYCDHGAYASVLGTTPTWGVPQEGDGTTKDAATASGTASIVFTANATGGSSSVSVCGVTFTASTHFTVGGSLSVTLDNLVAAINGSTTAVGSSVAVGTPQLRNLVFARKTGADTLDVMMRVGSVGLNGATNSNCKLTAANWASSTSLPVNFAGGSGGCWGWWINNSALGAASSIAVHSYGAWLALPMAGSTPTSGDSVWVRTGGGASKSITLTYADYNTAAITCANFGTNFVFDTNTKWTGDSASGTLKVSMSIGYSATPRLDLAYNSKAMSYRAIRRGGFEIESAGIYSLGSFFLSGAPTTLSLLRMQGVTFRDSNTSAQIFNPFYVLDYAGSLFHEWIECDYVVTTARTSVVSMFTYSATGVVAVFSFTGCGFNYNISGVGDPGQIAGIGAVGVMPSLTFRNCNFSGFAAGFTLQSSVGSWSTNPAAMSLVADNCTGLKMQSNYAGWPVSARFTSQAVHQIVHSALQDGSAPGLRIEDTRGVAEWVPASVFPVLASSIPGSGTAWSIRLVWVQAVPLSPGFPYCAPPMRMVSQLAAGARTITVELFIPSSVSGGIEAAFGYTDNTGVARQESTVALVSSSASWTNAGSYPTYAAKKLTLTTSYSVAANSEITCQIRLTSVAPSTTVNLYVDPEFAVS